jgi:hypothetical protein
VITSLFPLAMSRTQFPPRFPTTQSTQHRRSRIIQCTLPRRQPLRRVRKPPFTHPRPRCLSIRSTHLRPRSLNIRSTHLRPRSLNIQPTLRHQRFLLTQSTHHHRSITHHTSQAASTTRHTNQAASTTRRTSQATPRHHLRLILPTPQSLQPRLLVT